MAKTGALRHDQIELAPVVLFLVGEPVLGDRAVSRLIERVLERNPATAVTKIDAEQYAAGQLAAAVGPSLFAEPNVVAASNLQKMSDAFLADALAYVAAPDPDVVLILRHDGGTRGKRLLDAVRAGGFQCCEIPAVKYPNEKAALVRDEVARARRRMTADAVEALVDAHGNDVGELVAATAQLLSDVEGTIDEAAVRTYYAGRIQAGGFDIADAAVAGNGGTAVSLARHALASGVAPVPIVAALAYKLRTLALVAARKGASARPGDPTMSPGQRRSAERIAGQWSNEALATAIQAVAQADAEVKGASRDPEFALERVILRVAAAKKR